MSNETTTTTPSTTTVEEAGKAFYTPEIWDKLNVNEKKAANDTVIANGKRAEAETWLRKIAATSGEKREELLKTELDALAKNTETRRYYETFFNGTGLALKSKATGKTFRAALDSSLALVDAKGGDFSKLLEGVDDNELRIPPSTDPENPAPKPTKQVLFPALPMPQPKEKTTPANDLTIFLQGIKTLAPTEYNEVLKNLTSKDVATVTALSVGILDVILNQIRIDFVDNVEDSADKRPLPKSAEKFIQGLISISEGEFSFQLKDEALRAKMNRGKSAIIEQRNSLMKWQAETGVGLIDIVDDGLGATVTKGKTYTLNVFEIISDKVVDFIKSGVSVESAQLALTAVRTNSEAQKKLLAPDLVTQAEGLLEEVGDAVKSIPAASNELKANVVAMQEKAQAEKQAKLNKAAEAEAEKQTRIGTHLQTIADYRKKLADPEQPITTEDFESYVESRIIVKRDDFKNLEETEAKGKAQIVRNNIESLLIEFYALTEKDTTTSKQQRQEMKALTTGIEKAYNKIPSQY